MANRAIRLSEDANLPEPDVEVVGAGSAPMLRTIVSCGPGSSPGVVGIGPSKRGLQGLPG